MYTICFEGDVAADLYLPKPGQALSEDDVWQWYNNIPLELGLSFLDQAEKGHFSAYYRLAGLLRTWRRSFFRHHYSRTFARAASFLLEGRESPRILDLGGGTGTQSLLLALMGARVIVLDMDWMALRVLKKRQALYEKRVGRELDITAVCVDAFCFDYRKVAPIQGVYSLFAFNVMQPSRKLLALICPYMVTDGRLVVQDGNRLSWLPRVFPSRRRRVLSPVEFESEVESWGFEIISHTGGAVFPPAIWMLFPAGVLRPLDEKLGRNWLMPVSHQIMATKRR